MVENENTDNSSLDSFYSSKNIINLHEKLYNNNYNNNDKKETSGILKIISDILTDICEEGKSNPEEKLKLLKPFISKKIPSITIINYIERLFKYSKVSENTMILVLIYIDRICANHKINLNYYNIHKIILASFIVTIKFYEDDYYSLAFYAKLGGVTIKEINILEYEFLKLIDFKLFVSDELYEKYNTYLKSLEDSDNENDNFEIYDDL